MNRIEWMETYSPFSKPIVTFVSSFKTFAWVGVSKKLYTDQIDLKMDH